MTKTIRNAYMGSGGVCHYCKKYDCICGIPEVKAKVILNCTKEFCNEDEVGFINISSDIQERDVLTFKCPKCGETEQSLVFG